MCLLVQQKSSSLMCLLVQQKNSLLMCLLVQQKISSITVAGHAGVRKRGALRIFIAICAPTARLPEVTFVSPPCPAASTLTHLQPSTQTIAGVGEYFDSLWNSNFHWKCPVNLCISIKLWSSCLLAWGRAYIRILATIHCCVLSPIFPFWGFSLSGIIFRLCKEARLNLSLILLFKR